MQEMSNVVRAVAMPPGASIAPLYQGSNLADAYAVGLPSAGVRQMDMQALARVVLCSQPRWAQWLLAVRDIIVTPFGIKTAKQLAAKPDGRIGIFRIYAVSDDESSWARRQPPALPFVRAAHRDAGCMAASPFPPSCIAITG